MGRPGTLCSSTRQHLGPPSHLFSAIYGRNLPHFQRSELSCMLDSARLNSDFVAHSLGRVDFCLCISEDRPWHCGAFGRSSRLRASRSRWIPHARAASRRTSAARLDVVTGNKCWGWLFCRIDATGARSAFSGGSGPAGRAAPIVEMQRTPTGRVRGLLLCIGRNRNRRLAETGDTEARRSAAREAIFALGMRTLNESQIDETVPAATAADTSNRAFLSLLKRYKATKHSVISNCA